MKPKTLVLFILVLAAVAGGLHLLNRPDRSAASSDTRVGESLIAPALVERAARIELSDAGNSVRLRKSDSGAWLVESYHDLPADFSKLSSLVDSFASAKIERLVTRNPERIARLEFTDTRIALADADGKPLVSVTLGKHADGGGRFVHFDETSKAYLSRVNAWIDSTARNWADTALLTLPRDEIAAVTLTFPDGEPVTLARADKAAAFTAETTPEGRQVKSSAVSSLLNTVGALRYTETHETDAPDAVDARKHARTLTLKTFSGQTYTVALGRRPESTKVKSDAVESDPDLVPSIIKAALQPSPEAASEPVESGPASFSESIVETVPAGSVFAFVTDSETSSPINALMKRRAFQVAEHTLTTLPQTPDELFEPASAETTPAESADGGE